MSGCEDVNSRGVAMMMGTPAPSSCRSSSETARNSSAIIRSLRCLDYRERNATTNNPSLKAALGVLRNAFSADEIKGLCANDQVDDLFA